MIKSINKVYNFKHINIVWQDDSKREKAVKSKDEFAKFCKNNRVTSVSFALSNYSNKLGKYMKKSGLFMSIQLIKN